MRLTALVVLTVGSIMMLALGQVESAPKQAADSNNVATILYAAGAFLGVIFTGVTGLITALGANRKAKAALEETQKTGVKADDIAKKVDGGAARADQQIKDLQSDLKKMHDDMMALQRERVADVKETAAVAATAAASAVVPPVITDRRKEDKGTI